MWTVATGLAGATDDDHRDARLERTTDEENSAPVEEVSDEEDKKSESMSMKPDEKIGEETSVQTTIASNGSSSGVRELEPLYGIDRPFFQVDLLGAVNAAVRDAMRKDEGLVL
jgi:solute carrier family 26 (sodium-independent sulfate anion transporter), member 11